MLAFITAQVLIACYAYLVANKECAYIKERIDYAPINSPHDDPWHGFGLMAVGVVLIALSIMQHTVEGYVLAPIAGAFLYSLIYDAIIGEEVYDNPYYLGTTSEIDNWLFSKFGKNAGKRKVQLLAGAVVLLNLLFILL